MFNIDLLLYVLNAIYERRKEIKNKGVQAKKIIDKNIDKAQEKIEDIKDTIDKK